jgi:hypothetical protein
VTPTTPWTLDLSGGEETSAPIAKPTAPIVSWYAMALNNVSVSSVQLIESYKYHKKIQTMMIHSAGEVVKQPQIPITSKIKVSAMIPGTRRARRPAFSIAKNADMLLSNMTT